MPFRHAFDSARHAFRNMQPPPLIPTLILTGQSLAFVHFFRTSIGEFRECEGWSMAPTMAHEGEYFLVSPLPYWSLLGKMVRRPQRGDVVFAIKPSINNENICKRVIGVEGDLIEVEVRRGATRKWMVPESDEHEVVTTENAIVCRKGEGKWIKVPKGHVWLAGDNMGNSTDSRDYGPLPLALVKGKVIARVFPSFKLFENPVRHVDGPPLP